MDDGLMARSTLPDLDYGDEVAGCKWIGTFKGGKSGGETWWKLQCVCGFRFERRASLHWHAHKKNKNLLCKNTHLHRDIKVGQRFNRLLIKSFYKRQLKTKRRIENRNYAICDCSCGTTGIEVLPELLRRGDVQSCGCYQRESTGNRFRTHGRTDSREFDLWAAAKERAEKYGIDFNLDLDDIVIPKRCPVLGIDIDRQLGRGRRQPNSPSLDKFIPDKGYVKGNVQVISWRANWLKSNGTTDEWIKIAKWCQKEEIKMKLKG